MEEIIKNFPKQFAWEPEIQNTEHWKQYASFILVGMGGSGLPGDILKMLNPQLDVLVHKDYGLPPLPKEAFNERLVIANSYSGNTEEPLSAFEEAIQRNLPVAALSMDGKLLSLARKHDTPYVQIPDTGVQPRMGLGFAVRALLKITGQEQLLKETESLVSQLSFAAAQEQGKNLAQVLAGKVPIIYSSTQNLAIAFTWKLKFSETAKIPAFHNVLPELNHSEINGFDVTENTKKLSERFSFLFLRDTKDHPRVQKRFEVLEKLYKKRGFAVEVIELQGSSACFKIFSSFLLADWATYYTALAYGNDPEQVPMVEEFKKIIG